MLQAVQPDPSPAPVKPRSGTDNSSDPALAVFAGMMAQAATPARAPEAQAPAERSEARDTTRAVEPAEARKATERVGEAEAPAGKVQSSTKGKGEEAQTTEPQVADAQAGQKPDPASTPQTPSPVAGADIPKAAPSQAEPAPIATNAPSTPAPAQLPETAETKAPPALPKELRATVESSSEPSGTQPQAALRELLHLPKVEVETPQLQPEKPVKIQAGPVAASAQTETGGDKPPIGAEETAPVEGAAKPASSAANHAFVIKADAPEITTPQTSAPKTGTPEGTLLPATEPVRPTQAMVHAEAPTPVRPNPVASQVEGSIRWILQNKSQSAELQLHPESLGRVVIQLKVEGQEVHARLWASENASLAVLQDHKAFLETSLKDQGLILSTFDLQSGTRGNSAQTAFQEQAGAAPRALPHLEIKQEMPTELRIDPADPYRVEVYA